VTHIFPSNQKGKLDFPLEKVARPFMLCSGEERIVPLRPVPDAKAIVLCDEVTLGEWQESFNLQSVRTTILADTFPYRHPQLCVYLELMSHRGGGSLHVTANMDGAEENVFASPRHALSFPGPLTIVPVVFRLRDCPFPDEGLYWIQVYCDEMLVGEHRLMIELG
jgi:hypothetical protein